jgi:hypothetical protein
VDYTEKSLLLTINQLLGNDWSFGAIYRLTQADLSDNLTEIPDGVAFPPLSPRHDLSAVLHQIALETTYNHPCGFFANFQRCGIGRAIRLFALSSWRRLLAMNAFAGTFPGRKAELRAGVLNSRTRITLNPLTSQRTTARRTFGTPSVNF